MVEKPNERRSECVFITPEELRDLEQRRREAHLRVDVQRLHTRCGCTRDLPNRATVSSGLAMPKELHIPLYSLEPEASLGVRRFEFSGLDDQHVAHYNEMQEDRHE